MRWKDVHEHGAGKNFEGGGGDLWKVGRLVVGLFPLLPLEA
jgi:hypothetical protein